MSCELSRLVITSLKESRVGTITLLPRLGGAVPGQADGDVPMREFTGKLQQVWPRKMSWTPVALADKLNDSEDGIQIGRASCRERV